jgi:hypothetical protein
MIGKTGCSIVGHGGPSVLLWDGPSGDWMFESDGNPLATFTGTILAAKQILFFFFEFFFFTFLN